MIKRLASHKRRIVSATTRRKKRVLWLYDHEGEPLQPYSLRNQFVLKAIKVGQHQLHLCEIGYGKASKIPPWFRHRLLRENRSTKLLASELNSFLRKNLGHYDVLWISQAHICEHIDEIISERNKQLGQSKQNSIKVIYDAAVDLDKRAIVSGDSITLEPVDLTAKMIGLADTILVSDKVTKNRVCEQTGFKKPIYELSRLAGVKECDSPLSHRDSLILCCDIETTSKPIFSWFMAVCLPRIVSAGFKVRLLVPATSPAMPTVLPETDCVAQGIEFIDERSPDITYFDEARVMVVFGDASSSGLDKRVQWAAERGVPSMVSPVIHKQLDWSAGIEIEVLGPSLQTFVSDMTSLLVDDGLWQQKSKLAYAKASSNAESQHDLGDILDAISGRPRRLVSVHQGKTAGTSFMNLLKQVYAEKLQFFYGDQRDTQVAQARCFHGHTVMRKDYMDMRRAASITFLRDPLSRAISLFFFQMERFNLTEEDFIPWLDDDPRYADIDREVNLKQSSYLGNFSGRYMNYESFDFIGITEYFELSTVLLAQTLNWPVSIVEHLQKRANVGEAKPKKIDIDKDVVARFKQRFEADYDLYDRAKQELFRKARIAGLETEEPRISLS